MRSLGALKPTLLSKLKCVHGGGGGSKEKSGTEKKHSPSISFSLALRFMLILSFAMLSLSTIFVLALDFSVTKRQDAEIEKSLSQISQSLLSSPMDELAFLPLPYYMTFAVWEEGSALPLATNDSLLPLLDSGGKNQTYFEKDFFTDSDLLIRYKSERVTLGEKELLIECAIDIENDSASKMISALPQLIFLSLPPILVLSFALSMLISRKTISAFKKLQEKYDREKAFTANVSHELKTPISIIDGHANLLKRWGKDDPKQLSQSIDAILKETENMSRVVTTLLDMSRLENGRVKIEKSRFYVTNLFVRLKEEFSALYPEMHFEIIDEDFIELETDEAKVHQIFTAILSNSVKFAGKKCKIKLSANKNGGKTELSAEDNGPGFAPEILPHIFERFYKGDSSHDRNISGSGLGLSIASVLANALGASIKAKNAPTGGALICLTFD